MDADQKEESLQMRKRREERSGEKRKKLTLTQILRSLCARMNFFTRFFTILGLTRGATIAEAASASCFLLPASSVSSTINRKQSRRKKEKKEIRDRGGLGFLVFPVGQAAEDKDTSWCE